MQILLSLSFLLLFLSFNSSSAQAQDVDFADINRHRTNMLNVKTDEEKKMYNDSLRKAVIVFLNTPGSYQTSLKDIRFIGDLSSPDGAFRMITWNTSLTNGTYNYNCFIQTPKADNNEANWIELIDKHKTIRRVETRSLKADNWYGALYYEIIPIKHNKSTVYTLLAWEGNDNYSNKKLLESMYFNTKGEPVFGKAIFESSRMNKRRIVFEYSKEAYLMLRYNKDSKQIIFNRLEPSKPELKGVYSFYQPTLTYDAYGLKKGEWKILTDVNPRNEKNNKTYINPKKAKKPKIK